MTTNQSQKDQERVQRLLEILKKLRSEFALTPTIRELCQESIELFGKNFFDGLKKAVEAIEQARAFVSRDAKVEPTIGGVTFKGSLRVGDISEEFDKEIQPLYSWAKVAITKWEIETKKPGQ